MHRVSETESVMAKIGPTGLVVTCSKGRGFESWHRILDRHFSHWFAVKIVLFV